MGFGSYREYIYDEFGPENRCHQFQDNRPSGIKGHFGMIILQHLVMDMARPPIGGGSRGLASWVNYVIWGAGNTASAGGEFAWLDSVSYGFGAETFADYLWLTNSEHDMTTGNALYWWQADTLDGRVHSNDTLFISAGQSYGPVFYKKVTSCQDDTKPPRNTYNYNLVFKSEFFPRSARIVFPDQADSVRRYARGECLIGSQATAPNKQYYIRFLMAILLGFWKEIAVSFRYDIQCAGQGWQAPG
jgi:hypothetical protein